ncbi:NAD-dependent epimerase/dehydratase family protein [Hoeflea ulvae]|uniref:NAD(P)-dependent oxidoreductase n=1 Tax=Hoeflea ulvae TaxID=2983764 RepID=A0ABT3YM44_9HYPH|nr:NAD(P)-dependent oxidoreductase [Hoeflea ulvae]MCY0096979.1 NAD(P)-dependent oxidoreductase [Hoeflea ulvae]
MSESETTKDQRNVVVTGAAGHLGRNVLAAFIEAGWNAQGLDIVGDADLGVEAVDLRDLDVARRHLANASVVAHCAALPRPVGYEASDVFSTNMALMYAAIAAAEDGCATRIIYASSYSIIGLPFAPNRPKLTALPITEDEKAAPQDVYATTKWLGEEMLDAYVRRTGNTGVSLRLPWIHTPESFAKEVVPIRDDPDSHIHLWAWIDARDAGRAFVAAAEADIEGHLRLFVSADNSFATRPSADLVAESWPEVPVTGDLSGGKSLIDASRAREMIGFVPAYNWSDYPNSITGEKS